MCTHVFQASGSPTVRRLGILGRPDAGGRPRERRQHLEPLRLGLPLPRLHRQIDGYGPGLNIRREKLDPILRGMAAETDGVELMMGQTATSLLREGGRVTGVADPLPRGRGARAARPARGRRRRPQLGGREDGRPEDEDQAQQPLRLHGLLPRHAAADRRQPQLWFLDPDMAYAFPTDDDLTMLACVPHKDRIPEFKADPEAAMARMYERVPDGPRRRPREAGLEGPRQTRRPQRTCATRAATGSRWSATPRLAADPLWGVGSAGPSRPASGWPRRPGRRSATRRSSIGPCAATPAATGKALTGHDRACTLLLARAAGSTPSKSSSSAPRPGTTSWPGASRCSASAGSSPSSC